MDVVPESCPELENGFSPLWLSSASSTDGTLRSSGPQLTLIQLLPSSTVAAGVRLKTGFGAEASTMPGGTPYPLGPPHPSAAVHVGGTREPLQYWLTMLGLLPRFDAPG